MPRAWSTVRRIWTALGVAWATATLAFTAAMDRHIFADTTPAFRFNAAVGWVVPSALFAAAVAILALAIRGIRRTASPRIGSWDDGRGSPHRLLAGRRTVVGRSRIRHSLCAGV